MKYTITILMAAAVAVGCNINTFGGPAVVVRPSEQFTGAQATAQIDPFQQSTILAQTGTASDPALEFNASKNGLTINPDPVIRHVVVTAKAIGTPANIDQGTLISESTDETLLVANTPTVQQGQGTSR